METLLVTPISRQQPENPTPQPFGEYFYTKEIIAGRIRGELAIRQTEIKTKEVRIDALGIFFKPSHAKTEIPLGLAAVPLRVSLNLAELNRIQKVRAWIKTVFRIEVLKNIDKRLYANSHDNLAIAECASSFPHLKSVMREKDGIVHFQTSYPGYTFAQLIEELSAISEEEISLPNKRLLVLSVFKHIFVMLDNLPRKSHGDFHPRNILVSVQCEEPEANVDQPLYSPSEIKTYAVDIGSIQNILAPSLRERKLFYTKQDDLRNLFYHLEQWWNPQLNQLLGITQLTRERVMQMLEQQEQATQQRLLSDAIKDYQLQRLGYLLNTTLEMNIQYEKEELQIFYEEIRKIYEIDEDGEGAPTVIMPYTAIDRCSQ